MKFLPVALAALFGVASAKKSFSGAQLQQRINDGKFNKKSLLRNAKPYDRKTKRHLDQNQQEEEEWQINGYYSIQYDTCLNLSVESEDMLDEDLINYAANGEIIAAKSYIIFNVCQTMNCYYDDEDSMMAFIVDIPSFFNAFVEYLPNQVEEYCQGCMENEDYCLGNLDAQQDGDGEADGEQDGEQQADNGERMLAGRRHLANGQVVEYINCDQCDKYECFEDENADGEQEEQDGEEYQFEDAIEWLYGLSECAQIENAVWGDIALMAGLICNDDGTGVEVGVFVNEDCTVFAPQLSYANYMAYDAQTYYGMSQEVVQYMFTNDFSCYYEEVQYINPYTEMDENEQEEEEDNGEAPEAAEWCQQLFGGDDFVATNMADCGYDADQNQDQEEEQEEDENAVYYDWYTYQLTADQMEDEYEVCMVITGQDRADYSHVYDSESNGRLYNYKVNSNNNGGLGAGAVTFIVLLIIGVLAAGLFFYQKSIKSDESKKAPLINDGTMA